MKYLALSLVAILASLLFSSCGHIPGGGVSFPKPKYPLGYGMEKYGDQNPRSELVEVRADFIPDGSKGGGPVSVYFLPIKMPDGKDARVAKLLAENFKNAHGKKEHLEKLATVGVSTEEALLYDPEDTLEEIRNRHPVATQIVFADYLVTCNVELFEAEFVNVKTLQATSYHLPCYPKDYRCRGYLKASVTVYGHGRRALIHKKINTYFDVDFESEVAEEAQDEKRADILASLFEIKPERFLRKVTSPFRIAAIAEDGSRVMVLLPEGATLQKNASMNVKYLSYLVSDNGERDVRRPSQGYFAFERQEGRKAWFRSVYEPNTGVGKVRRGQYAFIPEFYFNHQGK